LGSSFVSPTSLLFPFFLPTLQPISYDPIANPQSDGELQREDKGNEGNINIPLATSSLERKMLEYIAAQTQVLQAMAQTMVKIHQSITEQASPPEDHNTVTNDNHQNMPPPPFDKEKLSAMQTQT
jgi:N-acetyl-anhydromuramyl-L-alanine amidase AmpD